MNGWRIAGRVIGVVALVAVFLVRRSVFDAATTALLWWSVLEFIGWRMDRTKAAFRSATALRSSPAQVFLTPAEEVTLDVDLTPTNEAKSSSQFQVPLETARPSNHRRNNWAAVVIGSVISSVFCSMLTVILIVSPVGRRIMSPCVEQQKRDSASSEVEFSIVPKTTIAESTSSVEIRNLESIELVELKNEVESLRLKLRKQENLLSEANDNVKAALEDLYRQQQTLFSQQRSVEAKLLEANANVTAVFKRHGLIR